jgi:hypothetical protein
MEELIEYIAKSLVDDPTEVTVRRRTSSSSIILELRVASQDTGRIIGKGGRVANAMRNLLQAQEADHQGKRIILKIH